MRHTLEASGFRDLQAELMQAPLLLESAQECLRFEKESFGALHQMLSGLDPGEREGVWDEVARALEGFEENGRFVGPGELVIGAGTK